MQNYRMKRSFGVVLLIAFLGLSSAQPGYAKQDALSEDISTFLSSDVSASGSSQAVELHKIPDLNSFVEWVASEYETTYVGYLPSIDASKPSLIFRENVPERVQSRASELSLDFEFLLSPTAVSLSDLASTQGMVMRVLESEFPGVTFTSMLVTDRATSTNVIELYSDLTPRDASAVRTVLKETQLQLNLGSTTMVYVAERVSLTTTVGVIGGGLLSGSSGRCTGAFTATRFGVPGIASAAHCADPGSNMTYSGVGASFGESSAQSRGDAGWF